MELRVNENGFVFWNEKEQEYRTPLIRGLSATSILKDMQ